jgi:hypothetical protein
VYLILQENSSFLQEKTVEATMQKEEERGKKPKPEEQEGMPQRQHCPPEKRRGDSNPECHEDQQKRRCMNSRRTSPQKRRKGTQVDRRTKCCIRT